MSIFGAAFSSDDRALVPNISAVTVQQARMTALSRGRADMVAIEVNEALLDPSDFDKARLSHYIDKIMF